LNRSVQEVRTDEGGTRRARGPGLLAPLRQRNFALLWTGMAVSMLGDGIYFVAIAWQVYEMTDSPSSLSLVGLAWSSGMVAFLLVGGLASDRYDRRRVMIGADVVRLVAVLLMGVLSVTGAVEVWHLIALSFVYGAAEAFFGPAFTALVPMIVREDDLVQANSLRELTQPATYRLAGPAVGGVLVAAFGAGSAFLVDAGTFAVSILTLALMRVPAHAREAVGGSIQEAWEEIREGYRFVRARAWLWATLVAASIALLCFWGPVEVLIPYIVRNEFDRPASDFGLVLASAGIGGMIGATVMSSRGMPPQPVRFLYLTWGLGLLPIAGYAVSTTTWHLCILSGLFGLATTAGLIVWATLLQTRVPGELLGRVSSLDWLVSIGLTPVSFALTAPIVAMIGADATLIGAGVLGATATLALLAFVPGLWHEPTAAERTAAARQETSAAMSSANVG
jgi:DHA3 family tetracycline resistance protein-like MFS transporter